MLLFPEKDKGRTEKLLPARRILAAECNQFLQDEALGTTMKLGIKVQLSKGIV